MAPRKSVTARDLVAKNPSPAVRAIFQKALEATYKDQQEVLKKAVKIK
ncbi:hypothetical protein IJH02_03455 [Candidatus Saccharibacteria bacterium]|nr:hypothetical protein [Candidatus Saccharibacteria bacterium]